MDSACHEKDATEISSDSDLSTKVTPTTVREDMSYDSITLCRNSPQDFCQNNVKLNLLKICTTGSIPENNKTFTEKSMEKLF